MFKKIQQNLLLNHPVLWNIKIVPALFGALLINIFFFVGGYLLTKIDFLDPYGSRDFFPSTALIYMGAILTSVLLFIIWLVYYSKNNAFKSFYPKSSGGLYLEWILTFVIVLGFVLFPFSYYQGTVSKIKSYAEKSEMIHAVETLNLVKILIPTNKTYYYQEYPIGESSHSPKSDSENTLQIADTEDKVKIAESQDLQYPNYPDFTQLSLLNYTVLDQFYFPSNSDFTVRNSETVKQWLRDQNKKEISKLMDDFIALQKKHNLSMNFTKDEWMELIYNPSKYPVGDFNLINSYNYQKEWASLKRSFYDNPNDKNTTGYYVSYDELESAYGTIMNVYDPPGENLVLYMVAIGLAVCISLFVFSFRVTTGKSWLIALVSIGLILFINGILSLALSFSIDRSDITGPFFYISVMLAIFLIEIVLVLRKNADRYPKGKSDIYMNHLIWFVPAVPALIFTVVYILGNNQYSYTENEDNNSKMLYNVYIFMDKYMMEFVLGNICLTFISMWFFIGFVLRKWKSLPEQ